MLHRIRQSFKNFKPWFFLRMLHGDTVDTTITSLVQHRCGLFHHVSEQTGRWRNVAVFENVRTPRLFSNFGKRTPGIRLTSVKRSRNDTSQCIAVPKLFSRTGSKRRKILHRKPLYIGYRGESRKTRGSSFARNSIEDPSCSLLQPWGM